MYILVDYEKRIEQVFSCKQLRKTTRGQKVFDTYGFLFEISFIYKISDIYLINHVQAFAHLRVLIVSSTPWHPYKDVSMP